MIYSDAYTYVARGLSFAGSDADRIASAKDGIKAAIEEWNLRRDWRYLLMDTRNGFTVAACTSNGATPSVITTTTPNGFAGVNIGQTATGLSGTITVVSVGSTNLTLTAAEMVTGGPVTLTFSGDIPIVVGSDLYNLPTTIKRIYSVRLLTNERTLSWKDEREIDRKYISQTQQVVPAFYNNFNDASFSPVKPYGRLRIFPISSVTDTCRVRYYRPIVQPSSDSDVLDMPERYTFGMLILAKYYFLTGYNAENARTGEMKERGEFLFKQAVKDDHYASADRDVVLIAQVDWDNRRSIDSGEIIPY